MRWTRHGVSVARPADNGSMPQPNLPPLPVHDQQLFQDLEEHHRLLEDNWESQVVRRSYVIHAVNYAEARLFVMKQWIVKLHEDLVSNGHPGIFDFAEHLFLYEETPRLRNKTVTRDYVRLPLKQNIKYTFGAVARTFQVDWTTPNGLWETFDEMKAIRNAIAHPKRATDLDVYPETLELFATGLEWFDKMRQDLIETVKEKIAAVTRGEATFLREEDAEPTM